MHFLPSKSLVMIGVPLLLVAAAGVWFIAHEDGFQTTTNEPRVTTQSHTAERVSSQISEKDTDGDGLRDWEESLWGTDPENPDTDGDGTPDGEEVDANRNPAIAGPDDELATAARDTEDGEEQAPNTVTERFGLSFFRQYLSARQQSGQRSGTTQSLSPTVIFSQAGIPNETSIPTPFSESDIEQTVTPTSESVRTYGNALGSAIQNNTRIAANELIVLREALDANDPQQLSDLEQISAGYNGLIDDLAAMPVPHDATDEHVELVKSAMVVAGTVEALNAAFSDPLRALLHVGQYEPRAQRLRDAVVDLQEYFSRQGIEFSDTDAGMIFMDTNV